MSQTLSEIEAEVRQQLRVGDVVEIYNAVLKEYVPHIVLDFYPHHISLVDQRFGFRTSFLYVDMFRMIQSGKRQLNDYRTMYDERGKREVRA
jgi:hypothetical protein